MLRSAPPIKVAAMGLPLSVSLNLAAKSACTSGGDLRIGAWALTKKNTVCLSLTVAERIRGPLTR
eukprot:1464789-Amphidinium_carterae.3